MGTIAADPPPPPPTPTGLTVTGTVSSASLAQDCASAGDAAGIAARCAGPPADAGTADGGLGVSDAGMARADVGAAPPPPPEDGGGAGVPVRPDAGDASTSDPPEDGGGALRRPEDGGTGAPRPEDGGGASDVGTPRDTGGTGEAPRCGGNCQQSNMNLQFMASGTGSATLRVVSVRLLDASSGALLDTLTARDPQAWAGSVFVPWDGSISAGQTLRATFRLSAPNWTRIGDGNAWRTHSRSYRLEVVTMVNGVERVFTSAVLMREPEVVT
ncbi:MAG: hypothetical protein HY909_07410 [Deltaproteobacteria bacterium]|nr:hypothetical protein [Deltaproteobacteria bacterium]